MKQMASRPLIILPGGIYITERDVARFAITPRTKARLRGAALFLGFLLLFALGAE